MHRTEYYRSIVDRYMNLHQTNYAAGYQRNRFNTFNALLPPGERLRIFDFGCGSGENLISLATFNRYTVEFWREQIIPYITDDAPERDVLPKRRINPMTYPAHLRSAYGLALQRIAFTHRHPMPPQFMESSDKYRGYKLDFEERFRDNPLSYLFASIVLFRLTYS
jgi:hypothetical protein